MMRIILAVSLALLAVPANAVVVTFSVGATTYTTNITAMSATRFATWAALAYPTIPNPAYVTPCGPPLPACLPVTLPNPNSGQTALQQMYNGIVNNVLSSENQTAHAAVVPPTPLN